MRPIHVYSVVWLTSVSLLAVGIGGTAQSGQENDPDQPTVLLRGIVVDEAGVSVVGATIETVAVGSRLPKVSTKSVAGGAFLLRFPSDAYMGASIVVQDESKQLAGYIDGTAYSAVSQNIFRITLKPVRRTEVAVVNQAGEPVPDATVRMLISLAEYQSGKTDAQGRMRLTFPSEAPVNWIIAYKDGFGFDYFEHPNSHSMVSGEVNLPGEVQLTLNGAITFRVKVVDSSDQPVEGINVTPWIMKKAGKTNTANLSGLTLGKSDERGIAEFRFIPRDVSGNIGFWMHDERYYCPSLPRYSSAEMPAEVVVKVYKRVTVRGKVLNEDGSPAAGIRLQGEGRGATNMYFRGHASTKADGTYELSIYPEQVTLVAVTDEQFAARSVVIPATVEGKVRENVDFKLNGGCVISGKFTQGPNDQPVVNQTATLIQNDENGSQLVRWSQSDKNGRYRFRTGPGSYTLSLMDGKKTEIKVESEDLEFDCHVDRLPRGALSGKVVDGAGNPIRALIVGSSVGNVTHGELKFQTKLDGTFETEKWNDRIRLIAVSSEPRLFGTREIEADAEQTEIVLAPAAALECAVVDAEGKPVKRCRITASRSWPGATLTLEGQTDFQGKFTFPAVGPGMTWTITAEGAPGEIKPIEFQVGEAKPYIVPTLKMESLEMPDK